MLNANVLPDRQCGTCNVCCISLTIDEPKLKKVQGFRCRNLTAEKTCGIYPDRPETCRKFECGWRLLKWVKATLRPDRSRVLITMRETKDDGLGIAVGLLDRSALKAEGLAETIAAAVAAGRPVFLVVPGPPGHTSGHARIDHALAHAVATRDKAAILEFLRKARHAGEAGKTVPIRLDGRRTRPQPEVEEISVEPSVEPPS